MLSELNLHTFEHMSEENRQYFVNSLQKSVGLNKTGKGSLDKNALQSLRRELK